ncbi:hypothetical protein [Nonomuraea wenchangensis]|uniref:hypothetical protein n=1 Tax=Nonomuraea wenchangensis TaxID=568860 RepID=UPI0033FB4BAA
MLIVLRGLLTGVSGGQIFVNLPPSMLLSRLGPVARGPASIWPCLILSTAGPRPDPSHRGKAQEQPARRESERLEGVTGGVDRTPGEDRGREEPGAALRRIAALGHRIPALLGPPLGFAPPALK